MSAVIAYIRTWQKSPSVSVAERVLPPGDAEKGATLYIAKCQTCHGVNGHKAKYVALGGAEFLTAASDGFIATSIEKGRPGTVMLPFTGKISPTDVSNLVALLRSWKKPVEDEPELPPEPGKLQSVVINPKGPGAKFDEKADFISVELIRAELDKKASLIIADARPPSDYARSHIVGAIDVPFYKVEAFAPQIPKDKWILTYCACPHAASVKARDAFRKLGYKKVAVIDEGILTWRDRGYPTHAGAKP